MTDRDRLIELVDKAKEEYANDITDHTETDYIVETLLNEGVIVPPCKVGDKVYVVYPDPRYNWGNKELKMLELKVYAFHYFNNKANVEIRGDGNYINWDTSCFGVSVFLTKDEAEQKLKELK